MTTVSPPGLTTSSPLVDASPFSDAALSDKWRVIPSTSVSTCNCVWSNPSPNASPTELLRPMQKFSTKLQKMAQTLRTNLEQPTLLRHPLQPAFPAIQPPARVDYRTTPKAACSPQSLLRALFQAVLTSLKEYNILIHVLNLGFQLRNYCQFFTLRLYRGPHLTKLLSSPFHLTQFRRTVSK